MKVSDAATLRERVGERSNGNVEIDLDGHILLGAVDFLPTFAGETFLVFNGTRQHVVLKSTTGAILDARGLGRIFLVRIFHL